MNVPIPTLTKPAYFFPNQFLFDNFDSGNIDPRATVSALNNVASWKMFYLPFNITIIRYRFQADAGATGGLFYAGLYTAAGGLIFDIGAVSCTAAGQYGTGAAHDPGTVFFDAAGNPTSSIALTAGWYIYGWGAFATSGSFVVPNMGVLNATFFNEEITADVVGLPPGIVSRWGASPSANISGGHLPSTLGTAQSGTPTAPPNIAFFA